MELTLNLSWIALTTLMCWLWLSNPSSKGVDRCKQFVALAVVLLILFPVISMTDDIVAAQNPAETDCCQRRDHRAAAAHTALQPVATVTPSFVLDISHHSSEFAVLGNLVAPTVKVPALDSIQNRPPPAA